MTPDQRSVGPAPTLEHAAGRSRRTGFWLVAAAAICWSSGGLIARLVATDPWTTVFWRSVFCAAFLSAAVTIAQRGRLAAVVRETGWPGVLMAACFATASTCFIMALARTSVANTLVIQSLSPFIAGLGGWLFLGERVRSRTWIAMGVALLGTVVMLWGAAGAGSRIGDLLAFSWAEPSSASAGNLALLALFGIGQLGSGLLLFTAGARLIPVAEASLIAVLECVLGPLWVWLAVGERPGAFSLIGGAVILSALVAHTAADLARPPRPPGARVE